MLIAQQEVQGDGAQYRRQVGRAGVGRGVGEVAQPLDALGQ
jgi:hypothetical protein